MRGSSLVPARLSIRPERRFVARALVVDQPRSVTSGVLRPPLRQRRSRAYKRPPHICRVPGREAGRFGMGPAVAPGQDLAEVAGPARDGAADLAACERNVGNGLRKAAATWLTRYRQ